MSTSPAPAGNWIRGITIRQPWTTAILTGEKNVENRLRSWRTSWVLLHAARHIDRPALRLPLVARTVRDRELVTGAVVGVARIADCHQDPDGTPLCTPWAHPRSWHLVLDDVQALALPIPVRGQLGPWKPHPDLLALVREQLPGLRP